jgi:hypothetical protein
VWHPEGPAGIVDEPVPRRAGRDHAR